MSLRPEQIRRPGRPEAAAVCFDWQKEPMELERPEASPAASARKRGLVQVLVTATLAGLLYRFLSEHAGMVVGGIAGVLLVASMVFPLSLYAAIEAFVGKLTLLLQRGVTWLLMGLIFYMVFFPFSVLFRKGKRDKLNRWIEPDRESYWNDRVEPISAQSRKRLY